MTAYKINFSGELFHYGVGHDKGGHSGRYPWGSSNNEGSSARDIADATRAIAKGVKDAAEKHKNKVKMAKLRKTKAANDKAKAKAEQARQKAEEDKLNIIRSGDKKLIKKNATTLTDEEFKLAMARVDMAKQVKNINAEEMQAKFERLASYINTGVTVGKAVVNAYDTYNSVATRVNSVSKYYGGKGDMPVFGGNNVSPNLKKEPDKKQNKK